MFGHRNQVRKESHGPARPAHGWLQHAVATCKASSSTVRFRLPPRRGLSSGATSKGPSRRRFSRGEDAQRSVVYQLGARVGGGVEHEAIRIRVVSRRGAEKVVPLVFEPLPGNHFELVPAALANDPIVLSEPRFTRDGRPHDARSLLLKLCALAEVPLPELAPPMSPEELRSDQPSPPPHQGRGRAPEAEAPLDAAVGMTPQNSGFSRRPTPRRVKGGARR